MLTHKCLKLFSKKIKKSNDIDLWGVNEVINNFKENNLIKFNKNNLTKSDQNLECFIPFNKIINKTKAVAISKNFLEVYEKVLNSYDEMEIYNMYKICDEILVNKMLKNLDKLAEIKRDKNSHLKYSFKYTEETIRKMKFDVNLYNIKNYVMICVDPDRTVKKDLRKISHVKDIYLPNNEKDSNGLNKSIRTDLISYKDMRSILMTDQKLFPVCLVSQFQFSFIPKTPFIIQLEIYDELNDTKSKEKFPIESVDFTAECELLRMSLKELKELDKEMKKEEIEEIEEGDISIKEGTGNENFFKFLNDKNIHEKFNFALKIVDVDNFLNGNEII